MDETARRVLALLGADAPDDAGMIREIRLRAGRPLSITDERGERLLGAPRSLNEIEAAADALTRHSLYAREDELKGGYLALEGGCRAGVCGRWAEGRVRGIASICIRLARAAAGCADGCMPYLYAHGRPVSALTLSPPGLGKTTLLRDMARQFSNGTRYGAGVNVAVADERRELGGSGALDLGARTDILEGCDRAEALSMLVRTMRPDVIVTDELGREGDALAVREAIRCGAAVIASAHAASLDAALKRRVLKELLEERLFERIILLAGGVGRVQAIYDGDGQPLFEAEDENNAEE